MKIVSYKDIDDSFFEFKEYLEETTAVKSIISEVRTNGDKALVEISKRFGENIENIELSKKEIDQCISNVNEDIIYALKKAIKNKKMFDVKQFESIKELEYEHKGSLLGHKITPLDTVGAYVPGGTYPLPSSAIMTIIPAKVCGVKEVIMCSPKIHDVTVAAAYLSGVDRIFRVGGAQAIAAMAYGTETIPSVDKIVGPGNKYVTQAKKEVYGKCGIDFLAGPSEIMIIADNTSIPKYIAADFLSQAEHDPESSSVLISLSEKISQETIKEIKIQMQSLETKEIIEIALNNSIIINVDSLDQAILIANRKAPEHLEICFENANKFINAFTSYGSLFVGNYSAEVFGDYCSGTNHVLPTNGVARYSGGLSVYDYIKILSYQIISKEDAQNNLIPVASKIAEVEGLKAHLNSALIRS